MLLLKESEKKFQYIAGNHDQFIYLWIIYFIGALNLLKYYQLF
jgi:hypothetical protein